MFLTALCYGYDGIPTILDSLFWYGRLRKHLVKILYRGVSVTKINTFISLLLSRNKQLLEIYNLNIYWINKIVQTEPENIIFTNEGREKNKGFPSFILETKKCTCESVQRIFEILPSYIWAYWGNPAARSQLHASIAWSSKFKKKG